MSNTKLHAMTWTIVQHFPTQAHTEVTYCRLVGSMFSALKLIFSLARMELMLAHPTQPRGKVALAAARWVTGGKSTASVSITF